jgi:MFS family permease
MLYAIRLDALLAITICANTFFWFVGSLDVLLINQLGVAQFGFSPTLTGLCVVAEMLGIAAGGFISTRIATGANWYRVLAPTAMVMAVTMIAVALVPLIPSQMMAAGLSARALVLLVVLAMMGIAGGAYMVPLEAFIQVRPEASRKGAVIAAANFAAFTGILLSGPTINLFIVLHIAPSNAFAIMGAMAMIVSIILFKVLHSERKYV